MALPLFGQQVGGVSGIVRLRDGAPIAGAKVTAITACEGMHVSLVQEVTTSTDGSFYVPSFHSAECTKVRLYAEKADDLWIKTGPNIFLAVSNGTLPLVELKPVGPPAFSEIMLGDRGASVSIRVRDSATDRFIWAELHVQRQAVEGAINGSMDIATGRDGSADVVLLPAGEYAITVQQFACRDADYFTGNPQPTERITVEAGQRVAKDISVDVRQIKTAPSYDNPRGKPCRF